MEQREIYRHTVGANAGKTFYRTTVWDSSRSRDLLSVCNLHTDDEANSRALARLQGNVTSVSVNLAQSFAERRQTAQLCTNNLYRILGAMLAMKRGSLRMFQQALGVNASRSGWARVTADPPSKRLANHWLEYKYGWLPLLSDIYGAAELLKTRFESDRTVYTAKGSFTHNRDVREPVWNGTQLTDYRATHSTTVRYGLSFAPDNASRQILSVTGISNPALLAWELLPYSFIFDWFLPVGNYLKALDAYGGLTFVDGYRVMYRTASSQCSRFGTTKESWNSPYWYSVDFQGNVSKTIRSLIRTKLSSFPQVAPPSFQNPIGPETLDRFVTGLALLKQVSGRPK